MTAGRKWLRGPRGTGILYVKKGSPIRSPQIDLASSDLVFNEKGEISGIKVREDAKQFELWEKSTASVLALTNAISEYLVYGEEKVAHEILIKANKIRKHINQNKNLQLVGKIEATTGVSSFYMQDVSREEPVKKMLEKCGFIISSICDWDCPVFFPKNATLIFRISPHFYTSERDVEEICKTIDRI